MSTGQDDSLTGKLAAQAEMRRGQLAESAARMRRLAEQLIALIDSGDYAYVGLEHNVPLEKQAVETTLSAIYFEGKSRERIIAAAASEAGRSR